MAEPLEASIKKYTEQLAQDPKSRVFAPLADLYRKSGRYDEAIAVAQEGLKHHPTYLSGKISLARALFENGEIETSRKLLEDVVRLSPDNLLANRILADIYVQTGEKDKAMVFLRQLVMLDPGDSASAHLIQSLELVPAPLPTLHNTSVASPAATSVAPPVVVLQPDLVSTGEVVKRVERLRTLEKRIAERRRGI